MLHENWNEYSNKEIIQVKNEKCIKCEYGIYNGGTYIGDVTCDYYLKTGQRRHVRPEDCEHYLNKRGCAGTCGSKCKDGGIVHADL